MVKLQQITRPNKKTEYETQQRQPHELGFKIPTALVAGARSTTWPNLTPTLRISLLVGPVPLTDRTKYRKSPWHAATLAHDINLLQGAFVISCPAPLLRTRPVAPHSLTPQITLGIAPRDFWRKVEMRGQKSNFTPQKCPFSGGDPPPARFTRRVRFRPFAPVSVAMADS